MVDIFGKDISNTTLGLIGAGLGGLLGAAGGSGQTQGTQGYQGKIPEYTATRSVLPGAFSQTTTDPVTGETVARRPGSMGRRYFTDQDAATLFQPKGTGVMEGVGLPAVVDQSGMGAEAGATPTLSDVLGSVGLANLLSSLGFGGGTASSTFTPGTSADSTTTTTTPAESTFSLSDVNTVTNVASDPVSQYLQSLGYGATKKSVAPADIQSAVGEGFSLADIAGAFGTTEDILNQILNPSKSTLISNPASSTFTKGKTDTSKTVMKNAINDFFADRGFVVGEEKTVTQDDLTAALAAGFSKEQLATGLGTTVDNINAVLDYQYAEGGLASLSGKGYYLGGSTDGMADLIPATIDGTQPAALSDGEFVIPADVVSHLGNGNSDAGAKQLYSMMDRVRTERTGTTKQGPEIDPTKMMPA